MSLLLTKNHLNSLFIITCSFYLMGCQFPVSKNGSSVTYAVLGFGIVSVPDPDAQPDENTEEVTVSGIRGLGMIVSNQPGLSVALGYAESYTTEVPSSAENVLIEFSNYPDEGFTVRTHDINKNHTAK